MNNPSITVLSNPERIARRLRELLEALPPQQLPITYAQAAQALKLTPPQTIHRVALALEWSMQDDAAADRPLMAAAVVSRARGGLPAPGFFACAERLGLYCGATDGEQAREFHRQQLESWRLSMHVQGED